MTLTRLKAMSCNPNRYHELNFCKLLIKKVFPFNFCEDESVRLLLEMLVQKQSFNNDMHTKRVKNFILKMYVPKQTDCVKKLMAHGTLPLC